jgi:hypothetical protein
MPRFIGNSPRIGALHIYANAQPLPGVRAQLTYSQQRLLPADAVIVSLDTTDRGSKGRRAKRWFRWFATPDTINACRRATRNMLDRAGLSGPIATR